MTAFSYLFHKTVILSEKTKGFLHLYALKHCCFCFSTVFISLYLLSLQQFCILDLKCNYNQFHRILGQFSLNIGIYSPSFSYHFSGFVKAPFIPSMTFLQVLPLLLLLWYTLYLFIQAKTVIIAQKVIHLEKLINQTDSSKQIKIPNHKAPNQNPAFMRGTVHKQPEGAHHTLMDWSALP